VAGSSLDAARDARVLGVPGSVVSGVRFILEGYQKYG
jgi:hypothetical protein